MNNSETPKEEQETCRFQFEKSENFEQKSRQISQAQQHGSNRINVSIQQGYLTSVKQKGSLQYLSAGSTAGSTTAGLAENFKNTSTTKIAKN